MSEGAFAALAENLGNDNNNDNENDDYGDDDDDDDYNDDDDDDDDYLDRLMVPSPLTRSSPDPLWRPSLVTDTRFRMLGKYASIYSIHICQDLPKNKEKRRSPDLGHPQLLRCSEADVVPLGDVEVRSGDNIDY